MSQHEHQWEPSPYTGIDECKDCGATLSRLTGTVYEIRADVSKNYHYMGQNTPRMCHRCGAMVWGISQHDKFHERVDPRPDTFKPICNCKTVDKYVPHIDGHGPNCPVAIDAVKHGIRTVCHPEVAKQIQEKLDASGS